MKTNVEVPEKRRESVSKGPKVLRLAVWEVGSIIHEIDLCKVIVCNDISVRV